MDSTAYEHTTESHTTQSTLAPIRLHPEYPKSVPGMLKIAEIVLCILSLICASIDYWSHLGGGWVQFVASSAMLTTLILFLFHLFNLIPRLPGPWMFIEFLYYCVYCILLIIAAIVCCVRAHLTDAIAATTFFIFAALVFYAIDTFLQYREWQAGGSHANVSHSTTTTTTTYETKAQY